MRIDDLLVTAPLRHRVVWAEIDREARKGKPILSDHAPLVIDIDNPGYPFDAGWNFSGFANRVAPAERAMSHRVERVNSHIWSEKLHFFCPELETWRAGKTEFLNSEGC